MQPLNAARLFLGAVEGDADAASLVNKADRAIQSADQLLKGLLDISRLDHSNVEAKFTDIPLGPLFEDLINEASPMATQAGIEVRFVSTLLSVKADPDFLTSILRNFLSNARRYTKSGRIVLGARRCGTSVKIQVWDTGPGINEKVQDMIFEEFQRIDDVDNLGIRGAGLGLSVARRMADLMGSEIELKSIIGKGSVFSVTLERAISQSRRYNPPLESVKIQSNELRGLTVLCVDDEMTILEGMSALLSRWNCQVLTCTNGEDALVHICKNDVQAIIADFQLGNNENGLDVIRHLRPHLGAAENVCILSARKTESMERQAANENVKILTKPANPDDIRQFLLSCLTADAKE